MDGVSAVGSGSALFQAQVQVAAIKKQIDATREIGEMALKLIQSASIDPATGNRIDVLA